MAARIKPAGQTARERDAISLGRIEAYIDAILNSHWLCPSCKKETLIKELTPVAASLLQKRYDKLRPTLSSATVTATVEHISDALRQIAERRQVESEQRVIEHSPVQAVPDTQPVDAVAEIQQSEVIH